ncbi:ATP-dependent DNA helicase [Beggiatoa leptomitoformis]|uniref:AAA family ATPase n=1 Tax=Beggiatoa leptomitoformis TaxID=288004 RepID=A0A2N9YFJ7_9GAMM|nr:AAA family ATPase [Beggiatoa leptomitoformis]ALG68507.1 AAA family ATPase [Beggiatoa leptomitoformis]AUI69155.1 AAA family ATPase [Beggiatoa leptomitoformis]
MPIPPSLEITPEFQHALHLLENTSLSVFLTGKAGTGKSTLLTHFRAHTRKKIVVLAPTGVAALNVDGSTLHSFFRLPSRPIHPSEVKPVSGKRRALYQSIDTLVIDEISMVRADLLDVIDQFMRLNGRDSLQPFGGVQMVFIGDLFQLPPVVAAQEEELFNTVYNSPFFFSANVMDILDITLIALEKIYRQQEQNFTQLLNAIRHNQITSTELMLLNTRHQPLFEVPDDAYYITLCTTNKLAMDINLVQLEKLTTPAYVFLGKLTGEFEAHNTPADIELTLKVGAQVMFVKNDVDQRWVNGTLGRVKQVNAHLVQVETTDGEIYQVEPVKWEILKYEYDASTARLTTAVIGSFTQYPLRLAWAMTIHKSQGKTFDNAVIELGRGAFAHGQLYVALSRCRTLDGLVLRKPVRASDVIVDKRVIHFFQQLKPL